MAFVLVAGGAGYIGSHACKAIQEAGFVPVTIDNLSTGWRDAVRFGPFVEGDLLNFSLVDSVFQRYSPIAVMHFAGLSVVNESFDISAKYWEDNVGGSLNLVRAAVKNQCLNFIFSSSCATYGDHDGVVLDESSMQAPVNPYGATKLAVEKILFGFEASHRLNSVVFRYFNVAGADPAGIIGEQHVPETHLIPKILESIGDQSKKFVIYGDNYPTADGTCIRDYVHVTDIVEAHISGLYWLLGKKGSRVFNLGTGKGFSVRQVLDAVESVTGQRLSVDYGARRQGDSGFLVSGSHRAATELAWIPARSTLSQIVADAWRWHKQRNYRR